MLVSRLTAVPPQSSGRAAAARPAGDPPDLAVRSGPAPGAPRRVVIPADRPVNATPVSGSRTGPYVIGGTIAGGMAGGYVALTLLSASPLAAGLVFGGCLVGGAVLGYMAAK